MTDSQEITAPPRLIPTLVAGFDAITNHILLILFPVGLDLLIWFLPHLRLKNIIEALLAEMVLLSANEGPELTNMIDVGREVWMQMAEQINLVIVLRSYPVGIPSLMVSTQLTETPLGVVSVVEVPSLGFAFLIVIGLLLLGLVLGTLYYLFVAQAALEDEISWWRVGQAWPQASLRVILLAIVWVGLLFFVSIPASCIVSLTTLAGLPIGELSVLLYGGFLIWLIFPLLFSAHGIIVKQLSVWPSIRSSIRMTNITLPTTILFVLTGLILVQGLNILWQVPPTGSWLLLLGIAGHAFVVTGILAASFIYYRDADRWMRKMSQRFSSPADPKMRT